MAIYLFATAAAWLAASLIALAGQAILPGGRDAFWPGVPREQTSAGRRLPLQLLARLAFALVLVYALHAFAPAKEMWQAGLRFGALAGLLIYLPLAFERLARYALPAKTIVAGTCVGMVESAAAGLAAAMIFSLL